MFTNNVIIFVICIIILISVIIMSQISYAKNYVRIC